MQNPGAPLEIDSLPVGKTSGMIGMCCCPGRIEHHNDGVARSRNLDEDLMLIRDWRPDQVISLVEAHEFNHLGVSELPETFSAEFKWQHWPLQDLSAPKASGQNETEINEWFSALNEGQRLLFHCAAGLGRTGTLAARLLIMSGNPPDIAISMVRAVRPGTVESKAQENFLKSLK
ncbi:cyclin-dependent kinase inhibitor 3 family protein [Arenicellales bacterium IMCC55707]